MSNFSSIRDQKCPNRCSASVRINSRTPERFQCSSCKRTWAAHKKDFHFGLRLSQEKIARAVHLLQQGKTIRAVAADVAVSPATIQRWKNRLKIFNS